MDLVSGERDKPERDLVSREREKLVGAQALVSREREKPERSLETRLVSREARLAKVS